MQHGGTFSLAAAIWGWPPAPGFSAPNQAAPDSWLVLFRAHHAAESAVLSGMFTACRAGRDWVLEAAPKVTLALDTTTQQPHSAWLRRSHTLRQALGARAPLPVRLKALCSNTPQSAASASMLPNLLHDLPAPITDLALEEPNFRPNSRTRVPIVGLLYTLAPALSHQLTTLSVHPLTCPLPPPDFLPQLRSLSITIANDPNDQRLGDILKSVAPCLAQLSSVEIRYPSDVIFILWGSLAPAAPTHALTSFSTQQFANSDLINVVVRHMPALETLRVRSLQLHIDHSRQQWGVRELTVSTDSSTRGAILAMLPRSRDGAPVTLRAELVTFTVQSEEGLPATLADWSMACQTICVRPSDMLSADVHAAALRNTLARVCERLRAHGTHFYLAHWRWSEAMLTNWELAEPVLTERGFICHRPNTPVT